jgi:hypothetical protein
LQTLILCIRNRKQFVILITKADINTFIGDKKISPFAFSLKKNLLNENIKSKIVTRTNIDENNYEYDLTIAPLLVFFAKIKLNQIMVWKLVLMLLKPRVMIAIDWDIALNKACNSQKIKLYYLQHGVIAADHMYFGKNVLKNNDPKSLPYGFLSWDDMSAKNFESICTTFTIGNQWNNFYFTNTTSDWFKKDKTASPLYNFEKPVVLFTLTWGNHHQYIIPDFMIDVIKHTLTNYAWIIRLHPIVYTNKEHRDKIEQFFNQYFTENENKKFFWKEFNTLPLPLILTKTMAHITIESSVVIEAAQFGVTSLILNNKVVEYGPNGETTPPYGGPSYFEKEIKMGYAEIYHMGLNIQDWISQQKRKKPLVDFKMNSEQWQKFVTNSLN